MAADVELRMESGADEYFNDDGYGFTDVGISGGSLFYLSFSSYFLPLCLSVTFLL